jgi:hypothetical protein
LEGNGRGLIEVMYRYLLGGTEEIHGNHTQDSRWPGRNSNENLLNTSVERYRYISLLGRFVVIRFAQCSEAVDFNSFPASRMRISGSFKCTTILTVKNVTFTINRFNKHSAEFHLLGYNAVWSIDGVIPQNTELFITTAARTLNPTIKMLAVNHKTWEQELEKNLSQLSCDFKGMLAVCLQNATYIITIISLVLEVESPKWKLIIWHSSELIPSTSHFHNLSP